MRRIAAATAAWVVMLLPALLACGPASAVRLIGTSSTAAYIQQVREPLTEDSFESQTRLFERLRFDLLDLETPALSFHGSMTAVNNASKESIGDTRTRLYNAFIEYRPIRPGTRPIRYAARLGRQWVAGGVGSGIVDGIAVQVDQADWAGLTVFGGTLGIDRLTQLRFDKPEDSSRWGGEARIHPRISDVTEPEVAVSFADTHRNDQEESRRLGVRASLRVHRRLRLWSEVRHDFLLDRTYGTAAGAEFLRPSDRLRVWFEFNRRTSALPTTNFFSMFDQKPISAVRGGAGVGIGGPYRFALDFERTDFRRQATFVNVGGTTVSRSRVDRSSSYRFVLERGWMQVGARFASGFGGKQTGLVLSGRREIGRLALDLDVDYLKYDYGDNSYEDNDATSGIIAATYQVAPMTSVTAQVEGMNNRDLKRDIRLLARVDQRFRLGR